MLVLAYALYGSSNILRIFKSTNIIDVGEPQVLQAGWRAKDRIVDDEVAGCLLLGAVDASPRRRMLAPKRSTLALAV